MDLASFKFSFVPKKLTSGNIFEISDKCIVYIMSTAVCVATHSREIICYLWDLMPFLCSQSRKYDYAAVLVMQKHNVQLQDRAVFPLSITNNTK